MSVNLPHVLNKTKIFALRNDKISLNKFTYSYDTDVLPRGNNTRTLIEKNLNEGRSFISITRVYFNVLIHVHTYY